MIAANGYTYMNNMPSGEGDYLHNGPQIVDGQPDEIGGPPRPAPVLAAPKPPGLAPATTQAAQAPQPSPIATTPAALAPMTPPAPQPPIPAPTTPPATPPPGATIGSSGNYFVDPQAAPQATPQTPKLAPAGVPIANGVNVSPTDPTNDLRGQTILPGAGADRFAIAQDQLKNFTDASDPYYQRSLRDANASAAGSGSLGSGQLRTSLGDLALNRDIQIGAQGKSFLDNALSGSIDDAYKNVGIAQQQQGFQAGQQNQAFGQGVTQAELQNELLNSGTNRAATQLNAGNSGNPADTSLILSQLFGNQAGQAGQSLSGLIGNTVNRNAQTNQTSQMQQIMQALGISPYGAGSY